MIKIDKTSLSWMCIIRAFKRDFVFGYIKIAEAADLAESGDVENANIALRRGEVGNLYGVNEIECDCPCHDLNAGPCKKCESFHDRNITTSALSEGQPEHED